MMIREPSRDFEDEEARIRASYKRREKADVHARYSDDNPAHILMTRERNEAVLHALQRIGLPEFPGMHVLELGCGEGTWLLEFIRWGVRPENLIGIELIEARAREALYRTGGSVRILCRNAARTGLPDAAFDIVLQSTMFTSIADSALKAEIAREMVRVLAPNGTIVWYDFRIDNPFNRDVHGISRAEIFSLFPDSTIELIPITLAPPITRALAPYSPAVCALLSRVPFLCTHYLAFIRPPSS
ncbi:MAG: class I SAM-dependent methyltransferase [Elusimicrobiota bacterium]|jgi:SAM-dependent methyltransferase